MPGRAGPHTTWLSSAAAHPGPCGWRSVRPPGLQSQARALPAGPDPVYCRGSLSRAPVTSPGGQLREGTSGAQAHGKATPVLRSPLGRCLVVLGSNPVLSSERVVGSRSRAPLTKEPRFRIAAALMPGAACGKPAWCGAVGEGRQAWSWPTRQCVPWSLLGSWHCLGWAEQQTRRPCPPGAPRPAWDDVRPLISHSR